MHTNQRSYHGTQDGKYVNGNQSSNFITKVAFSAELQHTTKLLILENFRQYSMYYALWHLIIILFNYIHMFTCTIIYNYTAIEVNGEHVINGDLTIVVTGHYSADGDDYDYYSESTETVSSTGPLVNPVTLQVCTHMIILIHYSIHFKMYIVIFYIGIIIIEIYQAITKYSTNLLH